MAATQSRRAGTGGAEPGGRNRGPELSSLTHKPVYRDVSQGVKSHPRERIRSIKVRKLKMASKERRGRVSISRSGSVKKLSSRAVPEGFFRHLSTFNLSRFSEGLARRLEATRGGQQVGARRRPLVSGVFRCRAPRGQSASGGRAD